MTPTPAPWQRSPRWRALSLEMDVAAITIGLQQLIVIVAVASVLVAWIMTTADRLAARRARRSALPFVAYALIRHLADRQRRLFEQQLPDNLSVVASAMRAGQPFIGALQSVVDSAPEPSKRELRRAVTDGQLGVPLDEALGTLGERLRASTSSTWL